MCSKKVFTEQLTSATFNAHRLLGHQADKSSITVFDKLGVLLYNSTTSAIQLFVDVLELACNVCG
jgi:hypothetical protein